jgi:hypothetical protein
MAAKTDFKLGQAIDSALGGGTNTPLVYLPPGQRTQTRVNKPTKLDVKDQLIRIQHEADPVGFLIAAMNGEAFQVHIITEGGEQISVPMQASMKDRIKIAMHLADKLMPNLNLHKHITPPGGDGNSGQLPGASGMTFAQMVAKASSNADHAPKAKVTTVDEQGNVEE